MTRSAQPQQTAFAQFAAIEDGVVLDIGCGPGRFRMKLPESVYYIGLDPIPLPEVEGVDFIRALAEHIPIAADSVRHVTVLSALDHFNDVEAFLTEVVRVLEPEGRMHVIQQIHEPHWSVRGIAHLVKDRIEDRQSGHSDDVPHHMAEFDRRGLHQLLAAKFSIEREQIYSASRLAPRRLFLTARPVSSN